MAQLDEGLQAQQSSKHALVQIFSSRVSLTLLSTGGSCSSLGLRSTSPCMLPGAARLLTDILILLITVQVAEVVSAGAAYCHEEDKHWQQVKQ